MSGSTDRDVASDFVSNSNSSTVIAIADQAFGDVCMPSHSGFSQPIVTGAQEIRCDRPDGPLGGDWGGGYSSPLARPTYPAFTAPQTSTPPVAAVPDEPGYGGWDNGDGSYFPPPPMPLTTPSRHDGGSSSPPSVPDRSRIDESTDTTNGAAASSSHRRSGGQTAVPSKPTLPPPLADSGNSIFAGGENEATSGNKPAATDSPVEIGASSAVTEELVPPEITSGTTVAIRSKASIAERVSDSMYDPGECIDELKRSLQRVNHQVVGREELLMQSMYALLTREHQLIYSRAGIAKSMYASAVFSQFSDAHTFSIQLTKGTPEEGLVGALDIDQMKKGNIIHNTTGSMVEADFAFLDEIFDGNDVTLRAVFGIINERLFIKGKQHVEARMHSAIATSNYVRATDITEALLDRFAFRSMLLPDDSPYNQLRVDESYGLRAGKIDKPDPAQLMPLDHLEFLADLVEGKVPELTIGVPRHVLFLKNEIIDEYVRDVNEHKQSPDDRDIYVSPRTKAKARDLINASALLRGREEATIDDLPELRFMITTVGDPDQKARFEAATKKVMQSFSAVDLQAVDFLMEAHDLLEAIVARKEGGEGISTSMMDRIKLFFGISTLGQLTFGKIDATVRKVRPENDRVVALQAGILNRIQSEKTKFDGKDPFVVF